MCLCSARCITTQCEKNWKGEKNGSLDVHWQQPITTAITDSIWLQHHSRGMCSLMGKTDTWRGEKACKRWTHVHRVCIWFLHQGEKKNTVWGYRWTLSFLHTVYVSPCGHLLLLISRGCRKGCAWDMIACARDVRRLRFPVPHEIYCDSSWGKEKCSDLDSVTDQRRGFLLRMTSCLASVPYLFCTHFTLSYTHTSSLLLDTISYSLPDDFSGRKFSSLPFHSLSRQQETAGIVSERKKGEENDSLRKTRRAR